MKFDTLYKTDSKNKIREWNVEVIDLLDRAAIVVTHGAKNGQMQRKITEVWEGKNIGKKNETNFLEQAILEAKSKWSKQCDKGYNTIIGEKKFLPMLANAFEDQEKNLTYPCYVQPKLDGCRSTISFEDEEPIARSRKGKRWNTIEHILDSIFNYTKYNPDIILDGEIFTKAISFQKIISAIKRDEPNDQSLLAEFWCYDLYNKSNPNLSFKERFELIPDLPHPFIKVKTILCNNREEIFSSHKKFLKEGYEGSIVRNINGLYKVDGRSSDLLKLKDFKDKEYKILDKSLDKNGETIFFCIDEELDKTFNCKPEGSHEERLDYYKEDNIGKMLTVRFFEFTDEGLPRFPVGVGIRPEGDL
jgi:DNA ligase-1